MKGCQKTGQQDGQGQRDCRQKGDGSEPQQVTDHDQSKCEPLDPPLSAYQSLPQVTSPRDISRFRDSYFGRDALSLPVDTRNLPRNREDA